MANFLISGGAGFIGSHLAEALFQNKHDVVSIDNYDPFYSSKIKDDAEKLSALSQNLAQMMGKFKV